MGILGPYSYENEEGKKFWLHKDKQGDRTIYYFSKNPDGALSSKPRGYTAAENPNSHMPYLKKGREGIIDKLLGIFGL